MNNKPIIRKYLPCDKSIHVNNTVITGIQGIMSIGFYKIM